MPLYEFSCKKCGKSFEALVQHGNTPPCEFCGSSDVEKQLSVFSAHTSTQDLPSCAKNGCPGFSGGACGSGMCGGGHR